MQLTAKRLGPFPDEMVNRTLGTELEPGGIYWSVLAQIHMRRKHPTEFPLVDAHLERIIRDPTFLGQPPRHSHNIEFIKRIAIEEKDASGTILRRYALLAAVGLEPDEHGDYRVKSGYQVHEEDVSLWRLKGNLLIPKK